MPRASAAIPRRRLWAALDRVRRGGSAAWVAGPPGSGKTTLVASWVAARRAPAVWVRLDAGDAELATFFHYLSDALPVASRRGAPLPALGPEHVGSEELFARTFFRAYYARLRRSTVLVLDDCHEIAQAPAIFGVLRAAVEELPRGITVVLAARGEPPVALAQPMAHGGVATIAPRELELTAAEARALARARRVRVAPARVEALRRSMQGWAAGFVLLLERGAQGDAPWARAATFEYFAAEVFERADPLTRRVLLEAALLDSPTSDLVAQVTGERSAPRLLAAMARRGLFTLRHEGAPPAFEFHALFREFLLARGREDLPPGRADEVRRAAAAVLAGRGGADAEVAMALLVAAGAHEEAAAVVSREAAAALRAGRGEAVVRWIEALPPSVCDAHPWIRCWHGAALVPRDPGAARRLLAPALEALDARRDCAGVWLAWTSLVESILLEWRDFSALAPLLDRLPSLRARYPFPSPEIEARVTLATAAVLAHCAPDYPQLAPWSERVLSLALEPGLPRVQLTAGAYFHQHRAWWLGEFDGVRPVVEALAPLAREPGVDPAAAILWLLLEATFHAATGDAPEAAKAAAAARGLAASSGVHVWDVVLDAHSIWLAFGRDDVRGAREVIARVAAAARPGNDMDAAFVHAYEAAAALRAGDALAAARLGGVAVGCAERTRYRAAAVVAKLLLARARSLAGPHEAATAALASARDEVSKLESSCFAGLLALVEAERHLRAGEGRAASDALSRALGGGRAAAGASHGQYLFSRDELAELLREALVRGVEVAAATELVRRRGLSPPPMAGAEWPREVRIRALGRFAVERGGTPVAGPGARRPLDLLRVLIALGGREVPEERVVEALWPGSDGDAAHHALETALYRLRRLLGQDAVVCAGRRLSISRERCWVDALELGDRLHVELAATQARRRPAGAEEATRAAELYAGPLLEGHDEPWASHARGALRRRLGRWLDALESATDREAGAELRRVLSTRDPALAQTAFLRSA